MVNARYYVIRISHISLITIFFCPSFFTLLPFYFLLPFFTVSLLSVFLLFFLSSFLSFQFLINNSCSINCIDNIA